MADRWRIALVTLVVAVAPVAAVGAQEEECPEDLGVEEPIGPCLRDGDGPGSIGGDESADHTDAEDWVEPPVEDWVVEEESAPAAQPVSVKVVPLTG